MNFNSLSFAIFCPIVFVLYWAVKDRYKWIILLASSYYFYMCWNVKYIVLIFGTTLISYICALLLEKQTAGREKDDSCVGSCDMSGCSVCIQIL